ncbi:MAG: hypothetical protein KDD44_04140, partial [Bdellovibrionales bacterium]|nr:hypothetical protein [Bdellovibrionales bacterium]
AASWLPKGTTGQVTIHSNAPGALIVNSAVYFHDCTTPEVQAAYLSRGRSGVNDGLLVGSYNTFLGTTNDLVVQSFESLTTYPVVELLSPNGVLSQVVETLVGQATKRLSLSSALFGLTPNSYGIAAVQTFDNELTTTAVRVRELAGRVDFAIAIDFE